MKIHMYSTEQQADELATELMVFYGAKPDVGLKALESLHKGFEIYDTSVLHTSFADCNSFLSQPKDSSGQWKYMHPGDFSHIHHSVCYRRYNLVKELELHAADYVNLQYNKNKNISSIWRKLVEFLPGHN